MSSWTGDESCIDCFRRGLSSFMTAGGLGGGEHAALREGYMEDIARRIRAHEPPPLAGAGAYLDLRARLAEADIFSGLKTSVTDALLEMLPRLRERASRGGDPLIEALAMSTWGNLLDVAQGAPLPGSAEILGLMEGPLALDGRRPFLDALGSSGRLLVLGDNAGETVLDRLFLEYLPRGVKVVYAVRPGPVMNDAVLSDAERAGIGCFAALIDTGLDAPTVDPSRMGPALGTAWATADAILAKGQGNLEGMAGCGDRRVFHSFVVKCRVISKLTGLPEGSAVFASRGSLIGGEDPCPSTSISARDAT